MSNLLNGAELPWDFISGPTELEQTQRADFTRSAAPAPMERPTFQPRPRIRVNLRALFTTRAETSRG